MKVDISEVDISEIKVVQKCAMLVPTLPVLFNSICKHTANEGGKGDDLTCKIGLDTAENEPSKVFLESGGGG